MIQPGAVITTKDPDEVVCGAIVVENEGAYNLRVYGDDPTTPSTDEGASKSDVITFYINGYPATPTSGTPVWTSGGLTELDLSSLVTSVEEKEQSEVPQNYELFQSYPNPFNPTTTIQFALPKRSEVSLKLFDVLGREVATLLDEELQPGEYKVVFEAEGLSSGVYFYRIQAKGLVRTKKLMLLK